MSCGDDVWGQPWAIVGGGGQSLAVGVWRGMLVASADNHSIGAETDVACQLPHDRVVRAELPPDKTRAHTK